jgi:hypothetical protein
MKIKLWHRHHGIHNLIKESEIEGTLRKYATRKAPREDDYIIKEDILISALPEDFLPVKVNKIMLCVEDKNKSGSTGQRSLKKFRNWAKYFDAYTIELCRS